jgi:hypothetical protein
VVGVDEKAQRIADIDDDDRPAVAVSFAGGAGKRPRAESDVTAQQGRR